MKKDIILAGVGGQGILSIAAVIGTAAIIWYLLSTIVHEALATIIVLLGAMMFILGCAWTYDEII